LFTTNKQGRYLSPHKANSVYHLCSSFPFSPLPPDLLERTFLEPLMHCFETLRVTCSPRYLSRLTSDLLRFFDRKGALPSLPVGAYTTRLTRPPPFYQSSEFTSSEDCAPPEAENSRRLDIFHEENTAAPLHLCLILGTLHPFLMVCGGTLRDPSVMIFCSFVSLLWKTVTLRT